MKEALFILLVMAVILALTAVRYRRQLVTGIQIWRSLKSMRAEVQRRNPTDDRKEPVAAGPLVSCAKCRTWVPEQRAIKLRGGVFYCSSQCLESSSTGN